MNLNSKGTNALIRDGAIMVTHHNDIIDEYVDKYSVLMLKKERVLDSQNNINEEKLALLMAHMYGSRYESFSRIKKSYGSEAKSDNKDKSRINQTSKINASETKAKEKIAKPVGLSAEASALFDALELDFALIDTLKEKANLSASEILTAITELELEDAIVKNDNGEYKAASC